MVVPCSLVFDVELLALEEEAIYPASIQHFRDSIFPFYCPQKPGKTPRENRIPPHNVTYTHTYYRV